jgi:hypothetical protein
MKIIKRLKKSQLHAYFKYKRPKFSIVGGWTVEMKDVLTVLHGIDVEDELVRILTKELNVDF